MTDRDDEPRRRSQLHIWEEGGREEAIGALSEDDGEWETLVILEQVSPDHVRGRLSFRQGDRRYDTAPVLVEESEDAVVRRARQLPRSMLRQLLVSARD